MTSAATDNGAWSIGRLIDWTRSHFESKGVDDARLCAELLLAHAMECQKIQLYARFHEAPTDSQVASFRELVRAAAQHEPIAYLIGQREFYSLAFKVTPDVLIPRPETELLVEHALAFLAREKNDVLNVLDVGTGSGCIAVTIAKREKRARVVAVDISEAALAVARQNAERHGVADRIEFIQADLFDMPANHRATNGFDLIVSNPPYVGNNESDSLPANVRDYEPSIALFAGDDGFDIYQRMAVQVRDHLRADGELLIEIGENQREKVCELFASAGMEFVAAHCDLAGTQRTLQFK
jgi:release factor glutamine methyltransferase